jgi:hypothetical protein
MNLPDYDSTNLSADVSIVRLVTMAQQADREGNITKELALLERARTIAADTYGEDSICVTTIAEELQTVYEKCDQTDFADETCTHLTGGVGLPKQGPYTPRCS